MRLFLRICRVCSWLRRSGLILVLFAAAALLVYVLTRSSDNMADMDAVLQKRLAEGAMPAQCLLPPLELWPAGWKKRKKRKIDCSTASLNWVSARGGVFRINPIIKRRWPDVECSFIPVLRADDYRVYYGEAVGEMNDGQAISADFFIANCNSDVGKVHYQLLHAGIRRLDSPPSSGLLPQNALGLNVIVFGLDSVSRLSWRRYLPKTLEHFEGKMQAVPLTQMNIVGDGTTQNLLALLTGRLETELPEARHEESGAVQVDDFPWIWKKFRQVGYVTQWGEDGAKYGTFQYRLKGFKDPPVDHYMRPYYLKLEELFPDRIFGCTGSEPGHKVKLHWLEDFMNIYRRELKFSFLHHSQLSHESDAYIEAMDDDLVSFLKLLQSQGHLQNTAILLISDHGHRYSASRRTLQGKYEERLPYAAMYFPPDFRRAFPDQWAALRRNTARLTTPLDLHETLLDLIDLGHSSAPRRGLTLLRDLPHDRNCQEAGIEPHWCTCLRWTVLSTELPIVNEAAQYFVIALRNLTVPLRSVCAELHVKQVITAELYEPSEDVLKFRASLDKDGRIPDMSDRMHIPYQLLRLTIQTVPGKALYEATLRRATDDGRLTLASASPDLISRINSYGNQASCLGRQHPNLPKFCFCNSTAAVTRSV